MAERKFDYDNVKTVYDGMKTINGKIKDLLTESDTEVESKVSVVDEALYGDLGSQMLLNWENISSNFPNFIDNFENWAALVAKASGQYGQFEKDVAGLKEANPYGATSGGIKASYVSTSNYNNSLTAEEIEQLDAQLFIYEETTPEYIDTGMVHQAKVTKALNIVTDVLNVIGLVSTGTALAKYGKAVWVAKHPKPAAGGTPVKGTPTSGTPAKGTPTSGTPTSGTPTAGTPKGGTPTSGTPTSGTPTAGTPTSGTPTAGTPKGGVSVTGTPKSGTAVKSLANMSDDISKFNAPGTKQPDVKKAQYIMERINDGSITNPSQVDDLLGAGSSKRIMNTIKGADGTSGYNYMNKMLKGKVPLTSTGTPTSAASTPGTSASGTSTPVTIKNGNPIPGTTKVNPSASKPFNGIEIAAKGTTPPTGGTSPSAVKPLVGKVVQNSDDLIKQGYTLGSDGVYYPPSSQIGSPTATNSAFADATKGEMFKYNAGSPFRQVARTVTNGYDTVKNGLVNGAKTVQTKVTPLINSAGKGIQSGYNAAKGYATTAGVNNPTYIATVGVPSVMDGINNLEHDKLNNEMNGSNEL